MSIFGNRLRELRDEIGQTQDDIGVVLGKTGGAVSKYESGDREPNLKVVTNLAKHFDTTSDYLLGLSNTKLNMDNVIANIRHIMGSLSPKDFGSEIEKKTGKTIRVDELESYINGDAIPTAEALEILAEYAGVESLSLLKCSNAITVSKYSCPEMEELDNLKEITIFKRVVKIAIKILKNELDVSPIEAIVNSMAQLKNEILSGDKKQKHL